MFSLLSFNTFSCTSSTITVCQQVSKIAIVSGVSIISNAKIGVHSSSSSSSSNIISSKRLSGMYSTAELNKEVMPKHVAFMLDGSRRWLKAQGRDLSYEPFYKSNARCVDLCIKWGIPTASIQICSLNNLKRGNDSNDVLLGDFKKYLENSLEKFLREKIKVRMIGETKELPQSLQGLMKEVEEATREETTPQLELILAIAYAGTRDIVEATRSLCEKVKCGMIEPKDINEALFNQEVSTHSVPPLDLFIRTGDRLRLSDYLTWESANAELYFSPVLGPEFAEDEFLQALRSYQGRVRSFGL